ncbi:GntR family transcriptional regulator [Flexivirga sp. ID2601S]|uniref:GntR family transcriptional regulator n=1 Tax=Flexivirga aerilata TaxID=1656889 RepID=A0A849ACK7_9MICO|nr:GntR family transcriptional regulator [Flexivirga aerilata]NNG38614.1 GntR family transcriptional regulator [Flexivirga aerilata]
MTLAGQAAERVRGWLYDGTIERDAFYSVPQMADLLGMSRSPVREGLLSLAGAGLIEFVPNRGFRAVRPSGHDIAEIFALRLALEPLGAARAAALPASADVRNPAATLALETMRTAAVKGDSAQFASADQRLHAAILETVGNARMTALIADLRDATRLLGASTAGRSRSLAEILDEHEPFVAAIEAGDGARAAMSMRRHLIATGRLLVQQAFDDGDDEAWAAWDRLVDEDE